MRGLNVQTAFQPVQGRASQPGWEQDGDPGQVARGHWEPSPHLFTEGSQWPSITKALWAMLLLPFYR